MSGSATRAKRSWWLAGLVGVLVVGVLVILWRGGSSTPEDPRAYAVSQPGISFEDMAGYVQVRLPECAVDDLSFAAKKSFSESMDISFTAARGCLDRYLSQYGVDAAHPQLTRPSPLSGSVGHGGLFPEGADTNYGWRLDPAKRYDVYTNFTTPVGVKFTAVVEAGPGVVRAFMFTTYVGLGGV